MDSQKPDLSRHTCFLLGVAMAATAGCGSSNTLATDPFGDAGAFADQHVGDSGAKRSDASDASVPQDHHAGDATPPTGDRDVLADAESFVDVVVARRPFPQLPNNASDGGAPLVSPDLVTIVASNDALLASLPAFSDAFPSSQVWGQVSAEYDLGTIHSVSHIVGPQMTGEWSTAALLDYVTAALVNDAGPAANGHTIYLVYLPDAADFPPDEHGWTGYHTAYPLLGDSVGDQLAVVQRGALAGNGETQLGQLTRVATHEIIESATDPNHNGYNLGETPTTTPWTASIWQSYAVAGHVELGDLCEGTRIFEAQDGGPDGGWEYQRIWSNAAALVDGGSPCIPVPAIPYFSAAVATDWYALAANGTVTIPIGGSSNGATSEWRVKVIVDYEASDGGLSSIADAGGLIHTQLGDDSVNGCAARQGMNNGVQGTITITGPPGIRSGDFAVFKLIDYHVSPDLAAGTCDPPLSEDDYHFWPFGVYVP